MQKHQTEHIRAVLQALDENMSYREIEAWLHISKTAAGRIRTAAVNSGLSTQELCGLDDEELQKIFYPPTGKVRVDPDWEQVHSLLKRKKVTFQDSSGICVGSSSPDFGQREPVNKYGESPR